MDVVALKLEVLAAFREVPKPSLDCIAPHDCLECDDLRRALDPYSVDRLPAAVLEKHRWDLPLLSDEAKQYYLPAWLVASSNAPDSDYTQALLFALDSEYRWFPLTPYTERQWRAIDSYLDYISSRVDVTLQDQVSATRKRQRLRAEQRRVDR